MTLNAIPFPPIARASRRSRRWWRTAMTPRRSTPWPSAPRSLSPPWGPTPRYAANLGLSGWFYEWLNRRQINRPASQRGWTDPTYASLDPSSQYGSKLVAACAENGTHYADLTGAFEGACLRAIDWSSIGPARSHPTAVPHPVIPTTRRGALDLRHDQGARADGAGLRRAHPALLRLRLGAVGPGRALHVQRAQEARAHPQEHPHGGGALPGRRQRRHRALAGGRGQERPAARHLEPLRPPPRGAFVSLSDAVCCLY